MEYIKGGKMSKIVIVLILLFVYLGLSKHAIAYESDHHELDHAASQALILAQALTVMSEVEYCGAIASVENGTIVYTLPNRGNDNSCRIPEIRPTWTREADYHTHGVQDSMCDPWYEVPSVYDLVMALENNQPSYVGTPENRIWKIDPQAKLVYLLAGPLLDGQNIIDFEFIENYLSIKNTN